MNKYLNQLVLIIGFGKSGKSLLQFFTAKEAQTLIYDDRQVSEADKECCPIYHQIDDIPFDKIDLIACSPGVPPTHPVLLKAQKYGIPIRGEIQIGLDDLKNTTIGITGTNGKSTLTSLIAHILNHANVTAKAVGNIGVPITSLQNEGLSNEVLVIELSSYQIDTLEKKCLDFGLILNITPDHLNRYHTFSNYANAKLRLKNFIKEKNQFFCSQQITQDWPESIRGSEVQVFDLFYENYLEELGQTNSTISAFEKQNISAAIAICRQFNLSAKQIEEGLQTFKALPHRCEFVQTINEVDFYNDSKATNIESMIKGIMDLKQPLRIIMGGEDKGLDYSKLKPYFFNKVIEIFFIGQAKEKMAKVFENDYNIFLCPSLESAVRMAYQKSQKKDIVLLSPGTSSFDMFKNFEHRGEEFKRIVKQIAGEVE